MPRKFKDYSLYLKFIETYSPSGFKEIDRNDPLLLHSLRQ